LAIANGLEPKRKERNMAQNIFVAMPFKSEFDPVLAVIRDAANMLNARVERLDEQSLTGSIVSQVRSQVEQCDVMVAVASEENGNVYYEIGLAHCQKKPVVILTSDPRALKFDLRDHRAIVYDPRSPNAARDELVRTIKRALDLPSEPKAFIESAFGSSADTALCKALETVEREAKLHPPINVTYRTVEHKTLSIEVIDFLGTRVRAVLDVNGITTWKRMSR
jgi:hypothetical protein